MITTEQCLAQLTALVDEAADDAPSQAKGYLDVFAPLVRPDPIKSTRLLAELKGRFSRSVAPSLLRDDIIHLIDARSAYLASMDDDPAD